MDRKLNRIKTALVDKGKTNKWLTEQLGILTEQTDAK